MLGLGLASSHAPGMWRTPDELRAFVDRLRPEVRSQLPYTAKVEIETPGILEDYTQRFRKAFAVLREQVQAYKPDVLVMIGDDQGDMFDEVNNPIFAIYTGEEPIWGRDAREPFSKPIAERRKVVFQNHAELARHLHKGLVKQGFDVANLGKRFEPRGNPERGISHMVSNLVPEVDPNLEIPLVCVFINEYYPPLPSAERCYKLGEAIAEILADRPERIAIYASGGLSHYPGEYNVGWIDHALDKWLLERFERNEHEALKHLFTFDSDNLRAGTGEVRAWIAVAAAMKRPATIVDYIPAHTTVTGCGFIYWPPVESAVEAAERIAAGARA